MYTYDTYHSHVIATSQVGDGDLSFSRALASQRAASVERAELVATVYDARKELLGALENVEEMWQDYGCRCGWIRDDYGFYVDSERIMDEYIHANIIEFGDRYGF